MCLRRALASITAFLAACATPPPPAPELVGAWRLVRYIDTPASGAPIMAFGEHPAGLFIFSADGHASISFMRVPPEPAASPDPDPDACQPDYYCSYFGSYTIDPAASAWTIHVEGGNIPSFIGSDQTRTFTLNGDTLFLSGDYEDAAGASVHYERVLERAR